MPLYVLMERNIRIDLSKGVAFITDGPSGEGNPYLSQGATSEALGALTLSLPSAEHPVEERGIDASEQSADTAEHAAGVVDDFLDNHAGLFSQSLQLWREVKVAQEAFVAADDVVHTDKVRKANPDLGKRALEREINHEKATGLNQMLSLIVNRSDGCFRNKILPAMAHVDPSQRRAVFEQQAGIEAEAFERVTVSHHGPSSPYVEPATGLFLAYLEAQYVDQIALDNCRAFLQAEPEVAGAFLARLEECIPLARQGIEEYPGLLELLATDMKRRGDEGVLADTLKHIAGNHTEYAVDFLTQMFNDKAAGKLRKQMDLIITTMQFVLEQAFDTELHMSREEHIVRMAAHWEQWPGELATTFKSKVDKVSGSHKDRIENALQPFVRQGRLPGKGNVRPIMESKVSSNRTKNADKLRIYSKNRSRNLAPKSQDMQDIVPPKAEREPIKGFAWLLGKGGKGEFSLTDPCSIEAILQRNEIKKYLGQYNDKRLNTSVYAALQKLALNPYDPLTTKPWSRGHIRVDSSTQRLRRCSLQNLPGSSGSSLSSCIRIFYSVISGDEPIIALYGFCHKNAIGGNYSGLPPRS